MILHITSRAEWIAAQPSGQYESHTLSEDGFIHCSTLEQVLGPANALYKGQPDLVLLCIHPEGVQSPIVYEDCYESGQLFPHIYGPLNLDAVINVIDFPPNADGSFSLPYELKLVEGK
jgi:uncharacterized protein (DUF952 family)